MFKDRKDAGLQLAEALSPLKHEEPLILAIPRATHLFEEEGAMNQVADQAGSWFEKYLHKKHLEIDKGFIV